MSDKKLYLKPASQALINAFASEGVELKPTLSYQLISAAFGFWSHEMVRDYDVPFGTYRAQPFPKLKPQYNESLLVERIKRLCDKDEWAAQRLAQVVLDVLKAARLRVNGVKVLFDTPDEDVRSRIFKALQNPVFPPVHATVAIGTGELPAIAAISLRQRLELAGPQRLLSGGSLHNLIARAKTYLWVNPPAELKGAETAYSDAIDRVGTGSATIGLGFCVIQPFVLRIDKRQRYTVACPTVHFDKGQAEPWSTCTTHTASYPAHLAPAPWTGDALEQRIASLPALALCPNCLQIYSDDLPELQRTCGCVGEEARNIQAILDEYVARGVFEFTTTDLISRLKGKPYEVDRATPVHLSENATSGRFLSRNRATFGIRLLDEKVRVTDKNGQPTTTAKWRVGQERSIRTGMAAVQPPGEVDVG